MMKTDQEAYKKPHHAQAFNVPEGYFEHLTGRILNSTVNSMASEDVPRTMHIKVGTGTSARRTSLRRLTAAAAVVVGFILTMGLHTAQKPKDVGSATDNIHMATASSESNIDKMIDYVMYDEDDLYAYLIDN